MIERQEWYTDYEILKIENQALLKFPIENVIVSLTHGDQCSSVQSCKAFVNNMIVNI
jgi:hypothetical protein